VLALFFNVVPFLCTWFQTQLSQRNLLLLFSLQLLGQEMTKFVALSFYRKLMVKELLLLILLELYDTKPTADLLVVLHWMLQGVWKAVQFDLL